MRKLKRLALAVVMGSMVILAGCEKTEDDSAPSSDRDKFIGTWDGQSTGPNGPRNFTLLISSSNSAPDEVKMQGFDGGGGTVFATVSGNSMSIPSQIVGNETIQGTGTYANESIAFTFSVDDGQGVENRTGTATNRH